MNAAYRTGLCLTGAHDKCSYEGCQCECHRGARAAGIETSTEGEKAELEE